MNYRKIYDKLIAAAKNRSIIPNYTETHHILPKSMGGSNAKSNLVKMTPREHFLAHLLLYKIHKNRSMLMAIRAFYMGARNSRDYDWLKQEFSKEHSRFMKEWIAKNGNPFKGKKHTKATRELMSYIASQRIGELNPFYGKTHTQEAIDKIIQANKLSWKNGRKAPVKTKEHQDKITKSRMETFKTKGFKPYTPRSEETKAKTRELYKSKYERRPIRITSVKTGETIDFNYLYELREYLDIGSSNILKALNNPNRTCKGYKMCWMS